MGVSKDGVKEPTERRDKSAQPSAPPSSKLQQETNQLATRNEHAPASHEDGLVCTKLLSVDQDSDICEDVSAAEPVQVEQDITCMACELYAAVCCASHFVKFCKTGKQQ